MSDDRWRDTYDRWLTTNPADEFLGPDPADEIQARIEDLREELDILKSFLSERIVIRKPEIMAEIKRLQAML